MVEELTERTAKLFVMFKMAIEEERKAQSMYREVIGLCNDPVIREALQGLHDDEVRHEQSLIRQYNALRATLDDSDQVEKLAG